MRLENGNSGFGYEAFLTNADLTCRRRVHCNRVIPVHQTLKLAAMDIQEKPMHRNARSYQRTPAKNVHTVNDILPFAREKSEALHQILRQPRSLDTESVETL